MLIVPADTVARLSHTYQERFEMLAAGVGGKLVLPSSGEKFLCVNAYYCFISLYVKKKNVGVIAIQRVHIDNFIFHALATSKC